MRCKFFEAQNGSYVQAIETAPSLIKRLYLIEERARGLMAEAESPEEAYTLRHQFRQRWARPLVAAVKTWLTKQAEDPKVLPQSGFGKAVAYALKRASNTSSATSTMGGWK